MEKFRDRQQLGVANGGRVSIAVKDGKVTVNGANILGSVQAANGRTKLRMVQITNQYRFSDNSYSVNL